MTRLRQGGLLSPNAFIIGNLCSWRAALVTTLGTLQTHDVSFLYPAAAASILIWLLIATGSAPPKFVDYLYTNVVTESEAEAVPFIPVKLPKTPRRGRMSSTLGMFGFADTIPSQPHTNPRIRQRHL